jgi:hypothetical protein
VEGGIDREDIGGILLQPGYYALVSRLFSKIRCKLTVVC